MTALGLFPAAAARAGDDNTARLSVTIDGQPLDGDVVLDSSAVTHLVVGVENLGGSALEVDSVRLRGAVLGLTFFDYDTRVRTTVPARGEATWAVDLDLRDLARRASGLMAIRVEVRDGGLGVAAVRGGQARINGSLLSTYGLFGLGLLMLAGLLAVAAVLSLARSPLPAPSSRRGLRFVPAGCAGGLFGVFALSALRLVTPSPLTDFMITFGATLIVFGIGRQLSAARRHHADEEAAPPAPTASA
ncbi:hypothetical protein [Parafrankia sp. EUN1f]|uniref:hypothetical protein n=1 Tax=Parafrankia sp. EUN1f TaxID=102897 RepID=UPI001E4FD452|nr:hypothetical protein [Parafrankia sp. EUN1f]